MSKIIRLLIPNMVVNGNLIRFLLKSWDIYLLAENPSFVAEAIYQAILELLRFNPPFWTLVHIGPLLNPYFQFQLLYYRCIERIATDSRTFVLTKLKNLGCLMNACMSIQCNSITQLYIQPTYIYAI
jgi:hypothetical protein